MITIACEICQSSTGQGRKEGRLQIFLTWKSENIKGSSGVPKKSWKDKKNPNEKYDSLLSSDLWVGLIENTNLIKKRTTTHPTSKSSSTYMLVVLTCQSKNWNIRSRQRCNVFSPLHWVTIPKIQWNYVDKHQLQFILLSQQIKEIAHKAAW